MALEILIEHENGSFTAMQNEGIKTLHVWKKGTDRPTCKIDEHGQPHIKPKCRFDIDIKNTQS